MKKTIIILFFGIWAICHISLAQQWTVVPGQNPSTSRNSLNGVCAISANDVWAVGSYDLQPSFTLTQHWDGVNWTTVSSPNHGVQYNQLNAVKGLSSNNVYAVGYYSVFGTPQMMILHWDGASWTEQNTPIVTGGSSLQSIVIFGPNDIYAGGLKAVGAPGPTTGTLVTHWDGSNWNIEVTPNQSQNRHNEITDMKGLSPNDIWAVGYSRNMGENYLAMILHKTGSSWNIVSVPQPGIENFLYSIDIIANDNIWATGEYNNGSNYIPLFLHYNGTSWIDVNSPGGGAGIIHNSASDIWSTGSEFVHYDGSNWNLVEAEIPPYGSMVNIARISSTDMWAVGRYIDGETMKTLTMHYGNLITGIEPNTTPKEFILFQNYPNPFNPSTNIIFIIPFTQSDVKLSIYDVLGREIDVLLNKSLMAGNYEVEWNSSDYPSGVYFYKLSSNDYTETKRMVLMK